MKQVSSSNLLSQFKARVPIFILTIISAIFCIISYIIEPMTNYSLPLKIDIFFSFISVIISCVLLSVLCLCKKSKLSTILFALTFIFLAISSDGELSALPFEIEFLFSDSSSTFFEKVFFMPASILYDCVPLLLIIQSIMCLRGINHKKLFASTTILLIYPYAFYAIRDIIRDIRLIEKLDLSTPFFYFSLIFLHIVQLLLALENNFPPIINSISKSVKKSKISNLISSKTNVNSNQSQNDDDIKLF